MNRSGFTLLEILISLAVLSMIVFMTASISNVSLETEDRVQKRDEIYQMGRLVLQRISLDLHMTFLVANSELLGKSRDGSPVETAFVGRDSGRSDSLDFVTFSHWRMFRNAKEADQVEVGYYIEADPEDKELLRLMRREGPHIDNDVTKGGKAYVLAENIKTFNLEYYDGRQFQWTDGWNSREVDQKLKLPRAVKISFSFTNPVDPEEEITFETIAFIELWQFPVEF